MTRQQMVFAYSDAATLLEAIPWYEKVECDLAAISTAWMRQYHGGISRTFDVRGLPFPAVNFSNVHLILSPLVREKDGKRTLIDFKHWLEDHAITHIRITGKGNWERNHEYSRNGGRTWGRMKLQGQAPPQPAPTQVVEPEIPPAPQAATEDNLPLWD